MNKAGEEKLRGPTVPEVVGIESGRGNANNDDNGAALFLAVDRTGSVLVVLVGVFRGLLLERRPERPSQL